jgi:hypothetical protein
VVKRNLSVRSYIPAIVIVLNLLLVLLLCDDTSSSQIDTLDLYLQWAYPISISDMKLVDFDENGESEILVRFQSDTSQVGIISVPNQSMVWHSPRLHADVLSVAVGDRNSDGYPDIIIGGTIGYPWDEVGFFQIRNGPDFDSASTFAGFEHPVNAVALFNQEEGGESDAVVGTEYIAPINPPGWCLQGDFYSYDATSFSLKDSIPINAIRQIISFDLNHDQRNELILVEESWAHRSLTSVNHLDVSFCIRAIYPESTSVFEFLSISEFYSSSDPIWWYLYFGALVLSDFDKDGNVDIVVGYRASRKHNPPSGDIEWSHWGRLECFDAVTWEKKWEDIDSVSGDYVTGLAACYPTENQDQVVCAAYHSGLIKLKDGTNGADLAISDTLPVINHFALGDLDHDNFIELCIASDESLYVYETPSITTDVEEVEHPSRPEDFHLCQNYPNPFNPETSIRFTIPVRAKVYLEIFNILGERVGSFERYYMPGTYSIKWDGKNSSGDNVSSGVYLYRLTAGDIKEIKKMILLR